MHLHNGMITTTENETSGPSQVDSQVVANKTGLLPSSTHVVLKHNLHNIFSMLDDIEQDAKHGKDSAFGCDCNPEGICELVVNIRKHLNTMLRQCAVAGRCPAIKEILK